jgi:hypothetical protein
MLTVPDILYMNTLFLILISTDIVLTNVHVFVLACFVFCTRTRKYIILDTSKIEKNIVFVPARICPSLATSAVLCLGFQKACQVAILGLFFSLVNIYQTTENDFNGNLVK